MSEPMRPWVMVVVGARECKVGHPVHISITDPFCSSIKSQKFLVEAVL